MLDIYFQPEYGKLYEKIEGGICEVFEFKGESGAIKNMYIKRPVPWAIEGVQYYDVTTPYGYGGPIVAEGNYSSELGKNYYKQWLTYCTNNRIIAEFVRFHLFDNIELRNLFHGDIFRISENVVLLLNKSMDEIWMAFEHKVRKNVKKALNSNLVVTIDPSGEQLDRFLNIYYSTMKRNNAQKYYYFESDYFKNIIDNLYGQFMFFHVWYKETLISTELVLCSSRYVYSFLGGTLEEYYPMRPNDLLKYEIIKWSKQTGHIAFILGGGYGGTIDGIYRYKKAFAPGDDVPFFVGHYIHNQNIYDKLVNKRNKNCYLNENYFPLYRAYM